MHFLKYLILSFKNNLVKYRSCIFYATSLYLFPFLPSGVSLQIGIQFSFILDFLFHTFILKKLNEIRFR